MRGRAALILALATLVACKKSDGPAPAAPSNEAVAEPAPDPEPTPAEVPPPADGRPASVTDEMVAVADRMIVAMEAMGRDVTAAGTDCAKGASALRSHSKLLRPIAVEAQKFDDNDDPAAEEWFKATYMDRMMAAMSGMMQLAQTCSADQDFQSAAAEFGKAMEM